MRWPSEHFKAEELLSPIGLQQWNRGNLMLQIELIVLSDDLRNALGLPVLVNHRGMKLRGYRSPTENRLAGGVEASRHPQGLAIDASCDCGVDELAAAAKEVGFTFIQKHQEKNFCHLDCRTISW